MKNFPLPVIDRIVKYLRIYRELEMAGIRFVFSPQLADFAGTTPSNVRKDISLLGKLGKTGRGYRVTEMIARFRSLLNTTEIQDTILVGMGNIGKALINYNASFVKRDFCIKVCFDVDEKKTGKEYNS
ncbi:MAG: winged-helix domain-containing protein [Fibrobacterota bacterium]